MGMRIYVNGKKEEIENGMNIARLLEAKKIRPEVVISIKRPCLSPRINWNLFITWAAARRGQ